MSKIFRMSGIEKGITVLVLIMLALGFYFFNTNIKTFELYIQEDGIVEWLTVLGLLLGAAVCIRRFIRLRRQESTWFLVVTLGLAVLLIAAAGEEISWGQRILGIQSSEYFVQNNAQGETNFHNLVVNGVKLNKLIFSIVLVSVLGIFLIIFPLLYSGSKGFRKFVDASGIMIPRFYQILFILLTFGLTELINHGKRAELLEAGVALFFFLIIAYPANKYIYHLNKPRKH